MNYNQNEYIAQVVRELRYRNYSPKTVKSYCYCLKDYFRYKKNYLDELDVDHIKTFLIKKQTQGRSRMIILAYACGLRVSEVVNYVFESERGGKLTTATPQKVFQRALKKAGIKKDATFHSLRHSFATHLLENGVDVRYMQELLGHQNIRTTQKYTQVTNPQLKNIKSPFDF